MSIRHLTDRSIAGLTVFPANPPADNNPPQWDSQPAPIFIDGVRSAVSFAAISSDVDNDAIIYSLNTGAEPLPTGVNWDAAVLGDGTNYLDGGDIAAFDFGASQDFSVELRVKHDGGASTDRLAGKRDGVNAGWNIDLNGTSEDIIIELEDTSVNTFSVSIIDNVQDDDTEIHVAITVDRTADELRVYIDGVADAGNPHDISALTAALDAGAVAFRTHADSAAGKVFSGAISEVRVWDDVRTATEITDNKDIELGGAEANLIGYWKMNGAILASVTTVTDDSPNSNTLTDTGAGDLKYAATGRLVYDGAGAIVTTSDHVATLDDGTDTTDSVSFQTRIKAAGAGNPRIAAGRIGVRDFDVEPEKTNCAQAHFVVFNTQPTLGDTDETETMLTALLSVNPDLFVYLYTNLQEGNRDSGGQTDVKVSAETGPRGQLWPDGSADDWWLHEKDGSYVSTFFPNTSINITKNVVDDSGGQKWPEWKADNNIQPVHLDDHNSPGLTRIHVYCDVSDQRTLTNNTDYDGNLIRDKGRSDWRNDGTEGERIADEFREAHRDFFDRIVANNATDNSDLLIMGNNTPHFAETSDPNPNNWFNPIKSSQAPQTEHYEGIFNGGWCENLTNDTGNPFMGVYVSTSGVITLNAGFGTWRLAQNCYLYEMLECIAPKHVMYQMSVGISPDSRNPVVGTTTTSGSMALLRCCMAACYLDDGFFYATPTNHEFNQMPLWDEWGVVNIGTTGFTREHFGEPLEDGQLTKELALGGSSVWLGTDSNGIFKREYENNLVLSNSQKSLTGFRIIPVIAGGTLDDGHLPSGDWKLFNGFQDPAVNDDSIINTTNYSSGYRLNAIDGRILVRV